MNVEDKVKAILLELLDVKEGDIVPQALLVQDLGANSIDLVELTAECENAFGLDIDTDRVSKLKTVQDVADFLKNLLQEKTKQS